MIRLNIDITFDGLKHKTGYVFREKGDSRRGAIFKSTMRDELEDWWESFPVSPQEFHELFNILPHNNIGCNRPSFFLAASPTIAKFDNAIDQNGNIFQYAKFPAGCYSNGYGGFSNVCYEQIYVINSLGEYICIWEDFDLGPEI